MEGYETDTKKENVSFIKRNLHLIKECKPVHGILELEQTEEIMGQAHLSFYVWIKQSPESRGTA